MLQLERCSVDYRKGVVGSFWIVAGKPPELTSGADTQNNASVPFLTCQQKFHFKKVTPYKEEITSLCPNSTGKIADVTTFSHDLGSNCNHNDYQPSGWIVNR